MKLGNIDDPNREHTDQMSEEKSDAEREILLLRLELGVAEAQKDGVRSDDEGRERIKKVKGLGGGVKQEEVCHEDAPEQK